MQQQSVKISAGLILTNGKVILSCIPYGMKLLDIPKGIIESDETPEQTVIREVREETGIDITKQNIIQIGKFKQYQGKYLELPELSTLHCNSTFFDKRTNRQVQEHIGFKYIAIEDISKSFFKSLVPILQLVCGELKQKEMETKKIKEEKKENEEKKSQNNVDDEEIDLLLKQLKKQNEETKA